MKRILDEAKDAPSPRREAQALSFYEYDITCP